MTHSWLELVLWGVASLFFVQTGTVMFHLRWARRLPPLVQPGTDRLRLVSVVLAGRDEEDRIENTLRHLLAQQDVPLEVIAVDDRSVDRTGDILRRLAVQDPRLIPLRVDTLPDGWLGKCHACHVGAGRAAGDWILFTDADCWLAPDVIARAVQAAERDGVDHITLTPGFTAGRVGARAYHLAFLISLANWFSGVNRDRPKAHLGMGAFNLVRTTTYRACGGYEALRLTVIDDIRLGLLVRRAGGRTRAFIGGDDTACHWGTSVRGMIQVMEKNYFAAINYRTSAAIGLGIFGPIMFGSAFLGPLTGTPAGLAAAVGLWSAAAPAAILASRLGWPRWTGLLTPFMFPVQFYAVLNSAVVTLWHGGIRWRGTFYSLADLRRASVR